MDPQLADDEVPDPRSPTSCRGGLSQGGGGFRDERWKELTLSYHNPESILVTIYPYHGNFN